MAWVDNWRLAKRLSNSRSLTSGCFPVFETYDGRTFAGADASIFFVFVVFMSFFLKPLSVTLPYAARFTKGETSSRCAKSAFADSAKAETVTVAKWEKWATLARFSISLLNIGSVSDQ